VSSTACEMPRAILSPRCASYAGVCPVRQKDVSTVLAGFRRRSAASSRTLRRPTRAAFDPTVFLRGQFFTSFIFLMQTLEFGAVAWRH
jgi:hypothetical protein